MAALGKSFTIDPMATLRTKLASTVAALCAATVLGGCGSDSDTDERAEDPSSQAPTSSTTESPTEAGGLPDCDAVWVDGQDLPNYYTACTTGGETIKPVSRKCGYGAKFLEQDGRFYAMAGHQVTDAGDLKTDEDYQKLLATCQA